MEGTYEPSALRAPVAAYTIYIICYITVCKPIDVPQRWQYICLKVAIHLKYLSAKYLLASYHA